MRFKDVVSALFKTDEEIRKELEVDYFLGNTFIENTKDTVIVKVLDGNCYINNKNLIYTNSQNCSENKYIGFDNEYRNSDARPFNFKGLSLSDLERLFSDKHKKEIKSYKFISESDFCSNLHVKKSKICVVLKGNVFIDNTFGTCYIYLEEGRELQYRNCYPEGIPKVKNLASIDSYINTKKIKELENKYAEITAKASRLEELIDLSTIITNDPVARILLEKEIKKLKSEGIE